ncbi:MAG: cytochrome bc1 complex Rieske iron-sulfur subunit [Mycobacteriales bacterium]
MSDEQARPPRIGDEVPLYQPAGRRSPTVEVERAADGTPPGDGGEAPDEAPDPRDDVREKLVASVFLLGAAGAIVFVVMYWIHTKPTDNWINGWLGGSLGVSMLALGAGAVLWAKLLMPHEEAVEQRHEFTSDPIDRESAAESFRAGVAGSNIARRPILRRSLLLAGGVAVLPIAALIRSLGPRPTGPQLSHTDWTPGARLVDQFNNPIQIGDLEINSFFTVYPEGHTGPEAAATSAVMLIRLNPNLVRQAAEPDSYQGHVAYSKICTHAGCPASLYDQQSHTLLCPCHQSQFNVLEHCKPVFGPATRPLPQLPLGVDSEGYFIARADFNQPVGPGYWTRDS